MRERHERGHLKIEAGLSGSKILHKNCCSFSSSPPPPIG